jgi:hypothetical protein
LYLGLLALETFLCPVQSSRGAVELAIRSVNHLESTFYRFSTALDRGDCGEAESMSDLVKPAFTAVKRTFTLISQAVTLIGYTFTLISHMFTLIGHAVAFVGQALMLGEFCLALVGHASSSSVPVATFGSVTDSLREMVAHVHPLPRRARVLGHAAVDTVRCPVASVARILPPFWGKCTIKF